MAKEGKSEVQKLENVKNKRSFFDEIKSIFDIFLSFILMAKIKKERKLQLPQ